MSGKRGENHTDNMLRTQGHNCSPNLLPAVAVIAPANWLLKQKTDNFVNMPLQGLDEV